MSELIRFEYRRGAEEPDEIVTVDDDGSVHRLVTGAGSGASEVGWWRGAVEDETLEAIRAIRGSAVPTEPAQVSSAIGQWWAVLDDRPRRINGGELAALQSYCASTATEPETVVGATAWSETWEGEPGPIVMLRVHANGDTGGDVRFDDAADAPVAAFVTDEMETLGFLGSTFSLIPPVEATAVVRDRPLTDGRLQLTGSLATATEDGDGEPVPPPSVERATVRFRLVVPVASDPP